MRRPWLLAGLAYLALATVLTWPLVPSLGHALPGYPNVDALDTLMLRGLVSELLLTPWEMPHSDGIYYPFGYPLMRLVPNLMDHLSGAPFALILPFPLADGLWWLLVLAGNGLAAHKLGLQLGGSHRAGLLVGVAYAASEPILREANLLHAPQSLAPWAPLYLAAMLRATGPDGSRRDAWAAGVWMACSGLTYWYQAIFLAFGSVPLLLIRRRWRQTARAVAVSAVIALPFALPYALSWQDLPLADPSVAPAPVEMRAALEPLPAELRFVTEHGGNPLLLFEATPLDRSNRVSWVLLLAVVLAARRDRRVGALLGMAAVGYLFALGPYLKLGEDPLIAGGGAISLPFRWLGELHPFLGRLTWPERWGILVALGLAAAAAKAPRPGLLAGLLLGETLLLSGNAPLQIQDLSRLEAWRALSATEGAVLELPLNRAGLQAPLVGLHARYHRKDLVNPILLPPGADPPVAWKRWLDDEPLLVYLRAFEAGHYPGDPGAEAIRSAREAGIGAIAVDAVPGSVVSRGRINRYAISLGRHLGPPDDLGAVLVWWLEPPAKRPELHPDGPGWRERAEAELAAEVVPELDTLIEPTWGARKHQDFVGD